MDVKFASGIENINFCSYPYIYERKLQPDILDWDDYDLFSLLHDNNNTNNNTCKAQHIHLTSRRSKRDKKRNNYR